MRPGRPANAHVSSSLKGPWPLEAAGDTATDRLGTRNPQEAAASAWRSPGGFRSKACSWTPGAGASMQQLSGAQPRVCLGRPPHGLFPPRPFCWGVPSVWHVGLISPCREPELLGPHPGVSWTPSQPHSKELVPGASSQLERATLPLWGDYEEREPQAPFRGWQESLQVSDTRAVWGKGLRELWLVPGKEHQGGRT